MRGNSPSFLYMKNKNPLVIISTDWHLKESNINEILNVAEQEVTLANELKVDEVFWLGDMFDSRISQRQEVLSALDKIINIHSQAGIKITCIPGNHDKTDYTSDISFLTPFRYHPNFRLIESPEKYFILNDVPMFFVPYYQTDVWVEKYNSLNAKGGILFSHTAIEGSINNDGTLVQSSIKASMFSDLKKVFLGHYHNAQQPARNVFHLPSVMQNNFGEDEEKGFTVLYDDLSFDLIKSDFKPYREIVVDTLSVSRKEIENLSKEPTDNVHLRITLKGDRQSIKAINKKLFTDNGINVKIKYNDIDVDDNILEEAVCRELSDGDIVDKFKTFCTSKNYNLEEGLLILNRVMQWE